MLFLNFPLFKHQIEAELFLWTIIKLSKYISIIIFSISLDSEYIWNKIFKWDKFNITT